MVAQDLQGGEETREHDAPQIAPAIAEGHAGDGGRDETEREQLPYMAGCYDDEIIAAEGPQDSP